MDVSIYHMELAAAGRTAKLRIEISDLPGKEEWMCSVADFLGASRGVVAWKGARELGLFSSDAMEYDPKRGYKVLKPGVSACGILEIPEDGLDSVPKGQGDAARFDLLGAGGWTLESRTRR